MVSGTPPTRYDAFISYSLADRRLAAAIRTALHRFPRRWNRLRALNVFLDYASLAAGSELSPTIEKALDDSKFFILLASPDSAYSPWVIQETKYWISRNHTKNILIALATGTILWDSKRNDFDWTITSSLPRCLERAFKNEPLHVDLRWAKSDSDLSLLTSDFHSDIATIASRIHDRKKEDLIGADIKEHTRLKQLKNIALGVLFTLSVLLLASTVFALVQRHEAIAQRDRALAGQMAATASVLAERGQDASLVEQAAALAVESWRLRPNPQAYSSAAALLQMLPSYRLALNGGRSRVTFSSDGYHLAILSEGKDGFLATFETDSVKTTRLGDNLVELGFSPDGTYLYAVSSTSDITLWRVMDLKPVARIQNNGKIFSATFSPNGKYFASASYDRTVKLLHVDSGQELMHIALEERMADLSFSPNSAFLAVSEPSKLCMYSLPHRSVNCVPRSEGALPFSFSPNGVLLATAQNSECVSLVKVATGKVVGCVGHLEGETTQRLKFSPNGQVLAIETARMASLVSLNTGSTIFRVIGDFLLFGSAFRFSEDGKLFVTRGEVNDVLLIDVTTGTNIAQVDHGNVPCCGELPSASPIVFSSDGQRLVTGSWNGIVRVINTSDGSHYAASFCLPGHPIEEVKINRDGQRLLARCSGEKAGVLFDLDRREKSTRLVHNDAITGLDISLNGDRIATASSDSVRIFTIDIIEYFRGRRYAGEVKSAFYANRGLIFAVISDPNTVSLIDLDGRKLVFELGEVVENTVFSPDGRFFAANWYAGGVVVVNLQEWTSFPLFQQDLVTALSFSPDGHELAVGTSGGYVYFIDPNNGDVARFLRYDEVISEISYSADVIALGAGKYIRVLARDTFTEKSRLIFDDTVFGAKYNRDASLLAATTADGLVHVFDAKNYVSRSRFEHQGVVLAMAFGPDGRTLATGSADNLVRLFDLSDNSELFRLEHGSSVTNLAFIEDSGMLLTGSDDGTLRMLSTRPVAEIARIGDSGAIASITISLDGKFVVAGTKDGVVRILPSNPQHIFTMLCSLSGRNLGAEEWAYYLGGSASPRDTCSGWRQSERESL